METETLREALSQLKDRRRGQGQRHSIDVVLMIAIMATMSGYFGYRAIGDFVKRYHDTLIEYLEPKKGRLPAYATFRRVLMHIDTKAFGVVFEKWMQHYLNQNDDVWVSVDGKAVRGTAQREDDRKLAHMVTFFKSDSKEVLLARQTATKSNEIPLVQEMLKEFPLKQLVLTLDAMHCQSETLKAIKESGNDYVVQVKGNQKNS